MIPAPFEYRAARSVDHALDLLGRFGEGARALAGGQSLLPLMKLRRLRPTALVDLGRIAELGFARTSGGELEVGALTRLTDIATSSEIRDRCPILARAAGLVADPQVRNRATIGGAACHADPAGDLPGALVALDARFVVRSPDGERQIPASGFFRGPFRTALLPREILTSVFVPAMRPDQGWEYLKFTRRAEDWATVAVAAVVDRAEGRIGSVRVGLVGMGPTPLRAEAFEEAVAGREPGVVADAAPLAAQGTDPPSDVKGSAEFRRHLATVLVRRAVEAALAS